MRVPGSGRVRPLLVVLAMTTMPDPAAAQAATQSAAAAAAPVAPRRPHVDTLHGEVRSDDWFWLRTKSDPAVARYLEAENAYAREALAPTAALQERLYQEMQIGRAHV